LALSITSCRNLLLFSIFFPTLTFLSSKFAPSTISALLASSFLISSLRALFFSGSSFSASTGFSLTSGRSCITPMTSFKSSSFLIFSLILSALLAKACCASALNLLNAAISSTL